MEYFQDFFPDLGRFLWAVITNWAAYATGGVIVALLWLWSTLRESPVSKKVGIGVALVFLFFAFFNAWRQQYVKTKVGLTMEINFVGPADNIAGYTQTPLIIWATISNRGVPTIADTWDLRITTADGRTNQKDKVHIVMMDKPFIFEGKIKISPSQALYEKTKEPIPAGAKPRGLMVFFVDEFDKATLSAKGTKYLLTCRDISGNEVAAKATMTGNWSGNTPMLLGIPFEEVPQQQTPQ